MENMNFERHIELPTPSAEARQMSRSRLFPHSGDNSPSPVRRLYRDASRALTTSTRKDPRPGAPLTTRMVTKAPPSKVTAARLVRLVALRLSDPDKSFAWRSVSGKKPGADVANLFPRRARFTNVLPRSARLWFKKGASMFLRRGGPATRPASF
jgi:hypothetical protein